MSFEASLKREIDEELGRDAASQIQDIHFVNKGVVISQGKVDWDGLIAHHVCEAMTYIYRGNYRGNADNLNWIKSDEVTEVSTFPIDLIRKAIKENRFLPNSSGRGFPLADGFSTVFELYLDKRNG